MTFHDMLIAREMGETSHRKDAETDLPPHSKCEHNHAMATITNWNCEGYINTFHNLWCLIGITSIQHVYSVLVHNT